MWGILRSEWTKFRSYSWCFLGIAGAALTAPIIVFFMNISNGVNLPVDDMLSLSLRSMYMSQAGVVVAAAGLFGQEYSCSFLRTTFLAVPSRMKLLAAKLIVLTILVILTGIITINLNLLVCNTQYEMTLPLAVSYMKKSALAILSWVQLAWITSGLSVLSASLIFPIAVMFPLILGLSEMLVSFVSFAKYLPDAAAANYFLTTPSSAFLEIGQGVAVQFSWALVFCSIAVWFTLHRDVR